MVSKKAEKMMKQSVSELRRIAQAGGLSAASAEYELKRRGLAVLDEKQDQALPEDILDDAAA